jgi:hypothetical protein
MLKHFPQTFKENEVATALCYKADESADESKK